MARLELDDGRGVAYESWGDPNGRPVVFAHGTGDSRLARHPDDGLTASLGVRLVTVDRPGQGWTGQVGVVPALIPQARFDAADAVAFVCGPEVMMRFTAEALIKRGMATSRLQVSLERNMRCGVGWCGHCQLGPLLLCRDGPVVDYVHAAPLLAVREL